MITAVSHLTFAANDPDAVALAYEILLDRKAELLRGADGAPLCRFQFANIAFEILAAGNGGEGLASIAFETTDIEAAARKLDRRGLGVGAIEEHAFRSDAGRDELVRRVADIAPVSSHGVALSLVETRAGLNKQQPSPTSVIGLDHIVVNSPNPERAIALYGGKLGLDFALDRTNPDWGSRLLFFRCGGVTVEISHSLKKGISDSPDSLWGLAWRVPNIAETQQRLRQAGLDISEPRKGRRPGSEVFTVRSGTGNVPTLMLSAAPKDGASN